jgi:hypothetical protein
MDTDFSIKAFCVENNLAPATFHYWKKKYNASTVNKDKPTGFAAVHLTTPSPTAILAK